jgi:ammonia channel protein AmtB
MLWVGWFGGFSGSAIAAVLPDMPVTQIATAAGTEWLPSGLSWRDDALMPMRRSCRSGCQPPGCQQVGWGIGQWLAAGVITSFCYPLADAKLGYDDSLRTYLACGIGGIIGALLTGIFRCTSLWWLR